MDHPAELRPAQPWRAAAIVAAAIAAVELFVLVLVGVAIGAKFLSDRADSATAAAVRSAQPAATAQSPAEEAKTAAPAKSHAAPSKPTLTRQQTSVIVLNGNGISGVAATTAERVRRLHYVITATGNAPRTDFRRSMVMFRPGFKAEAARLAKDLHVRRVAPLDGISRADLQGAHLALIIGG
ncbi:MAG: LytR C-terminal domain-containing protein [Gaiellaceae bacterium]